MTIASEITRITGNIADSYTAASAKGATMPATQNSDNLATCIASIPSGGGYQEIPPYEINNLGSGNVVIQKRTNITLSGSEFSSVTKVSADALTGTFAFCSFTANSTLNFSSLQEIERSGMNGTFSYCTGIVAASFPKLETIGEYGLSDAFVETSLTNVTFPSLNSIEDGGLNRAFAYCQYLISLSFPALTSQSFGYDNTFQFADMLIDCSNVTVHFPSNLQSVIGNWSDVTQGFGGTNTTVLFDLPATS
jgi:hypothetical protein